MFGEQFNLEQQVFSNGAPALVAEMCTLAIPSLIVIADNIKTLDLVLMIAGIGIATAII